MGHFITPDDDPRSTAALKVKLAIYQAGESRSEWAINNEAASLSILINGRFCMKFEDREIVLSREGDYVLWRAGVAHTWIAESDCTIITVRYPSQPGDSVALSAEWK